MDGNTLLILIAAGGLLFVGTSYIRSLSRHPDRNCRLCKGGGRAFHWLFRWARGACFCCGGTGKHLRWGTRLFGRQ